MEPTTVTSSSAVAAPPPPVVDKPQPSLPRPVFWTTLAIAAALPVVLLAVLVIVMIATQYNFLNWME